MYIGTITARVGDVNSIGNTKSERRLLIDCNAELPNGEEITFQALVDTGAEINVINPNLIPIEQTDLLQKPWNLTAANQQPIPGGDRQAHVIIRLKGVDVDTGRPQDLKIPTTFLLADVGPLQAIVSYEWVSRHNFLVNGRRHGMCYQGDHTTDLVWIPGVKTASDQPAVAVMVKKGPGAVLAEPAADFPDSSQLISIKKKGREGTPSASLRHPSIHGTSGRVPSPLVVTKTSSAGEHEPPTHDVFAPRSAHSSNAPPFTTSPHSTAGLERTRANTVGGTPMRGEPRAKGSTTPQGNQPPRGPSRQTPREDPQQVPWAQSAEPLRMPQAHTRSTGALQAPPQQPHAAPGVQSERNPHVPRTQPFTQGVTPSQSTHGQSLVQSPSQVTIHTQSGHLETRPGGQVIHTTRSPMVNTQAGQSHQHPRRHKTPPA